jgi:hypothetical protein
VPYVDSLTPELPFQSSSDTSHDAAVAAQDFVGKQGEVVYRWFVGKRSGATQKEASDALGIARASMCARVRALEMAGRLVKTAARRDGCAGLRGALLMAKRVAARRRALFAKHRRRTRGRFAWWLWGERQAVTLR